MLWIYLIVLQILFFLGLLYFLRSVLTRNISRATGHLQELSRDYVSKEEEINRFLQNAQKEAKNIVAKELQAGQTTKEKLIREGQEFREQILKDAQQKSAEITERAQRNADFLLNEMDQKINERARELVGRLIRQSIPTDFLRDVHERWLNGSGQSEFDLQHLKLPDNTKEAKIVSAFPLTEQQQEDLKGKLFKKTGENAALITEVDPALLTGFILTVGNVVIDASLKYRIGKLMRKK
jgi:ATP synthase F1 delta subunit